MDAATSRVARHARAHVARGDGGGGAAQGGTAEAGPERPGEARTGWRWWRRASPAVMQARSSGEAAAQRRRAVAGRGERRRPDAVREEVGLGAESSEQRLGKLPSRVIGEGLAEAASRGGDRASGAAAMGSGARVWGGEEGVGRARIRRGRWEE